MENKASFQFNKFIVKKSFIELKEFNISDNPELHIDFTPSGVLNRANSTFELELILDIKDISGGISIHVISTGNFRFENIDDSNNENYLFLNAPAIMFPYIRAYISTLTALSGIEPLLLPTLNLSRLKNKLADKIVRID